MRVTFRILDRLLEHARADLRRPHAFAAERVGFIVCKAALNADDWTLLAYDYLTCPDDAYIDNTQFGALLSSAGFLPALQRALSERVCICHVHLHDFGGRVRFSRPDERESAKFMLDFLKVRPGLPHCALVVGEEHMWGRFWLDAATPGAVIDGIHVVGAPLLTCGVDYD